MRFRGAPGAQPAWVLEKRGLRQAGAARGGWGKGTVCLAKDNQGSHQLLGKQGAGAPEGNSAMRVGLCGEGKQPSPAHCMKGLKAGLGPAGAEVSSSP